MSALEFWQVVCPDGHVRHFPYVNDTVAKHFAKACTSIGCRLHPKMNYLEAGHPPCPGGEHTVRPVEGPRSEP